jgi:hypothetical protein
MSNFTHFDSDYALAPKDGNYGINAPETYFQRNPGLIYPNGSRMDCPISFQPEIGARKTSFLPRAYAKTRSFCQDRLGTNMAKVEEKRRVVLPGSTSSPTVESLRRFMRAPALNDFPSSGLRPNASLNPVWSWHNYEGFTTPDKIDRLERLGVPTTIEVREKTLLRNAFFAAPFSPVCEALICQDRLGTNMREMRKMRFIFSLPCVCRSTYSGQH